MKIPAHMNDILQRNDRLNSTTHYMLSVINPWFEDNKLVFFPEYTDHGSRHIQEVLDTAEALIPKEAWEVLTPEDIATLTLAIVLHDCAMHLSEDGFITLIEDDSRQLNDVFRDKPWKQLWDTFMADARRWDERKLHDLFGNVEPVSTLVLDPSTMTRRDRLLIGEFLRRHHPRIAQEIALTGVPGPRSKGLTLGEIPDNIKELGGIVARSHGLDLRSCVDHLTRTSRWGARRKTGVHVTYLMALVRIADYLQIHRSRAPEEVLKVRSLRSPVSRGEWNAHAAIMDIHQETDDPEAFWVEAAPDNVRTYLKLRHLLKDLQRELDDAWAVLGEVYGPKEGLRILGISIRRIKSNLDDSLTFAKTVQYIPRHASLETQGTGLLKLLIAPLYGNNQEIGIREFLQNSLDACRELKDYLEQLHESTRPQFREQSADIVIELEKKEDGTTWLTVSDNGIGMTVETVVNYFLKAGASFRNSDTWRKQHEDGHGHSRVLRSGRFGVGVLAGFLLGPQIEVSTRHITAHRDEGITFTCSLSDDAIQLDRISTTVGTTIRVQLTDSTYDSLRGKISARNTTDWDWYCLREPSVHRLISKENRLSQKFVLPSADSSLPPEWRRIRHPDYQDIHWSYLANAPRFVCNGIIVKDLYKARAETQDAKTTKLHGYGIRPLIKWLYTPKISVHDPCGKLPLNLQRTRFAVDELPFKSELTEDICCDLLAYLIVYCPEVLPSTEDVSKGRHTLNYPGLREKWTWYWYSAEGVSLLDEWHLQELRPLRLFLVEANEESKLAKLIGATSSDGLVPAFKHLYFDRLPSVIQAVHTDFVNSSYSNRILMTSNRFDRVKREERQTEIVQNYKSEWRNNNWTLLKRGTCPPIDLDIDTIRHQTVETDLDAVAILYPQYQNIGGKLFFKFRRLNHGQLSPLENIWKRILGWPYIPYDLRERKERLSSAYDSLHNYIEAWIEIKAQHDREMEEKNGDVDGF